MLAMLFPIVDMGANAEELTTSLTTQTSAYLYSTIALSTSDNIAVDIVPKAGGKVEVGTADVFVSTNNTTGYSISLSAVNPSNRLEQVDQTLSFENDYQSYGINPLSTKTTYANYLDSPANINTWGYALTSGEANSNTEYEGLTSASNTIKTVRGTASNDSYKLNVAVAADTSLPAGSYRNGLIVTAVANPITLRGFNSIYYMQQMTPEICNEIVIPEGELAVTGELVDKRDNTIYQVAKLLDGNCWMTQNLALDLSTEVALTPEDSDVTSDWTPKTSTETEIPLPNTHDNDTTARSWNFGKIVLTNPTASTRCNDIATGDKITDCEWYKNVSGLTAGYEAMENRSISLDGNEYDSHYLIGNYYQFGVATASTGAGIAGTNATGADGGGLTNANSSICPKGWQLPKSGRNISATETIFGVGPGESFDIDKSFYNLLEAYGYTREAEWDINGGNAHTAIVTSMSDGETAQKVRVDYAPMYFVRSGNIDPSSGTLLDSGSYGYGWSSTVFPDSFYYAYDFGFNATRVYPSRSGARYLGFPIRCIAK